MGSLPPSKPPPARQQLDARSKRGLPDATPTLPYAGLVPSTPPRPGRSSTNPRAHTAVTSRLVALRSPVTSPAGTSSPTRTAVRWRGASHSESALSTGPPRRVGSGQVVRARGPAGRYTRAHARRGAPPRRRGGAEGVHRGTAPGEELTRTPPEVHHDEHPVRGPGGRSRVPPPAPARAADKPNIVVILADDFGYGSLGCYGGPADLKTPNLDRLAKEGRKFTNAYAPGSVCSPTRYGLMTGRYYWRTAVKDGTVLPAGDPLHIETDRLTLASLCKGQGYKTAAFGKWHLGMTDRRVTDWSGELKPGPLEVGFDHFFGMGGNPWGGPHSFIEDRRVLGGVPGKPVVVSGAREDATTSGIEKMWDYDRITETLTDRAVEWIEANHKGPFLVYFAAHRRPPPGCPEPGVQGEEQVRHLRRLHRGTGRVRRQGARRPRPAEGRRQHAGHLHQRQRRGDRDHRRARRGAEGRAEGQRPPAGGQAQHLRGRVPRAVPRPLAGQGAGRDGQRSGGVPHRPAGDGRGHSGRRS